MDFGTKIRIMRALRNWSQLKLSKETGIPNTYISDIETGRMLPNQEWERILKEALRWPERAEEAFAILEGGEPCGEQAAGTRTAIGTV